MPVDLDKIRALLASVAGFTPGPWRMSIENGSGIVAGHRHAVVSANSSALGWPVVLVERRSRPVMLAAPDLHRHASELADEVERLRAEVEALRAGQDEAVAAERHRIGAWIRAQKEVNVVDRLSLSRAIEHGDHIDDDAPPLPSLRSLMLLRDELRRQIAEAENALNAAGVTESSASPMEMRTDAPLPVVEGLTLAQRIERLATAAAAKERADVVAFLQARLACRAAERDDAHSETRYTRLRGAAAELFDVAEEVAFGNHARPNGDKQ